MLLSGGVPWCEARLVSRRPGLSSHFWRFFLQVLHTVSTFDAANGLIKGMSQNLWNIIFSYIYRYTIIYIYIDNLYISSGDESPINPSYFGVHQGPPRFSSIARWWRLAASTTQRHGQTLWLRGLPAGRTALETLFISTPKRGNDGKSTYKWRYKLERHL